MSYKESFLQFLQIEKRYSPHTVRSYLDDLDQFYFYLSTLGHSDDIVGVTSYDIRSWIVSMIDNGYSTSSVHRKISCLRVYFKYLRKEGIIKSDPLEKVEVNSKTRYLPVNT
jgi:integrase/recombinase XerC